MLLPIGIDAPTALLFGCVGSSANRHGAPGGTTPNRRSVRPGAQECSMRVGGGSARCHSVDEVRR
jgi:hypothetical protein